MFPSIFLLPVLVSAGVLTPKTPRPIVVSPTNQGQPCDFTFHFQVELNTFPDSILRVSFPKSSYVNGLSGVPCTARLEKVQELTCWMTDWEAHIAIGELSNSPVDNTYTVTISGLTTPKKDGVTGHFKLSTWTGINLLDYNDFFGQIGITPAYDPINVASLTCVRSCESGQFDDYLVTFQLPVAVPATSRVFLGLSDRMLWDIGRGCKSTQIPGILCTQYDDLTIKISNFKDYFSLRATIQILFPNVQNPFHSGPSVTFQLSIYQPTTETLLTRTGVLPGPVILPSVITVVSVCPNSSVKCNPLEANVVENNVLKFTIEAKTSTTIPEGGAVQVVFSLGFQMVWANTCLILSGLTSPSGASCLVSAATRTATVANLASFPPGQFSLSLILTTPIVSTTSCSFTIATYTDSSFSAQIDATPSPIPVPMLSIKSPGWSSVWSTPLLAGSTAGLSQVRFTPLASIGLPSQCEVRMRFSGEFGVPGSGALTTSTWDRGINSPVLLINSYSDPVTNLVVFPLPNPTTIPFATNQVSISGVFQLPNTPGSYPVSVSIVENLVTVEALEWWVTILPTTFTSATVNADSYNAGSKTIIEIVMVPSVGIPASSGSAVYGSITVEFPLIQGWAGDLGTGLTTTSRVPCLGFSTDPALPNALLPLTGGSIACTLKPSILASNPLLTVSNFQAIPTGSRIQLNLVDFANVSQAGLTPSLILSTYSNIQLSASVLNTGTVPYTTMTIDTSLNPGITNGRNKPPYGDGQNQVIFMPNMRGSETVMRFVLWPENDIPSVGTKPGSAIFLKFPLSYPLPDSGISCIISYTTPINCFTVPLAGWIVIYNLASPYTAHTEYPFDIKGLTNPLHRIPQDNMNVTVIVNYRESEYLSFVDFPLLDLGMISPATVTADNYESTHVDCNYFFLFTPSSELRENSKIVLSFPKNFYVTTTTPRLSCSLSGLSPVYGHEPECAYQSNTVTVTGFGHRDAGLPIMIKVKHVLNPVAVGLTDYFSVETFSEVGWLMDANYYVVGVQIVSKPPPPKLLHVATWADPSNGYHSTSVTISFLPTVTIPSGAMVEVRFPKGEWSSLPLNPHCSISGAITLMESCSTEVNVLRLETRGDFTPTAAAQPFNVTLSGLTGFTPGITSGPFFVQIQYSGIVVNESPQDESSRKVTSDLEPFSLQTADLTYSPLTAGEAAVYNLTIFPHYPLNTSMVVGLQFPDNYPGRLTDLVLCYSPAMSKHSDGLVDCEVTHKTLYLHPSQPYFPLQTGLFISISRIINPDFASGPLRLTCFTKFSTVLIEESVIYPTFSILLPPKPAILTYTKLNTHSIGTISTLNLTFQDNLMTKIQEKDKFFVDFPGDFELEFVKNKIKCFNSIFEEILCDFVANRISFSANLLENPVFRYSFSITGLENPWKPTEVPYITVLFYQVSSFSIIFKTISNLNPINSLNFLLKGQEILINGGLPFTQQRGTRSFPLFIYLERPCKVEFELVPRTERYPGVSFVPEKVKFELGDVSGKFEIRVESKVEKGKYAISWDMLGQWVDSVYSPVHRFTLLVVTDSLASISVQTVDILPQGGVSYPNIVELTHSPATELLLTPIKLGSQPSKIEFSPKILNFTSGETRKTFVISVDSESKGDKGEFFLYQSGVDAGAFALKLAIFRFNVGFGVSAVCNVTDLKAVNVTKTSAEVKFASNMEISMTWMRGLKGVREPTLQEMQTQRYEEEVRGGVVFGVTEGRKNEGNQWSYQIDLKSLQADSLYVVYLTSTSETYPTPLFSLSFRTSPQARPAYATFRFLRSLSSPSVFLSALSELLLLNVTRMTVFPPNETYPSTIGTVGVEGDAPLSTTTGGSRRMTSTGKSLSNVLILFRPDDSFSLTPFQYLSTINTDLIGLKTRFPLYDDSSKVQPRNIPVSNLKFLLIPRLTRVTNSSVTISDFLLSEKGVFYVCVSGMRVGMEEVTPFSKQIYYGTDSRNGRCGVGTSFPAGREAEEVRIEGLQADTAYWVYVTASNTLPGEPDLIPDDEVVTIGVVTGKGLSEMERDTARVVVLTLLLWY